MAHYLTNNEKFHIFSKSPVLSSMAVSQAVNKSGHTVSTNDVWADDVPWFTEVADEAGAITRAADARYNDLILWGSDIYVRKGDKTNGASTGTTFAELWEKHTELTEARAYALGSVTTQTPTNIVTKTVEIKNASDKVVLKYHVGKQIDLLTTANNANVASTWAARMFIDGKVVDQFVSPTDKVFAGNPSTGYTTLVYTATAAGNKYGFVAEGEADADFVNNAFAGIVQFNQSRNSGHKFAASVFEYVGDKLDATVAALSKAVFGEGGSNEPGEEPTSLTEQVEANTKAITKLNGAANVDGSVLHTVQVAIDGLDNAADQQGGAGISVVQTNGVVNATVITATVATDGTITNGSNVVTATDAKTIADTAATAAITAALADTEGSAITEKIESEIADATLADGQTIAETTDTDKLVTVEDVKTYVENNAKVSIAGGNGISVTPAGKATEFTVSVDTAVVATQTDVSTAKSELQGEIDKINTSLATGTIHTEIDGVRQIANAAKNTADTAVQSVSRATGSSELITVTDGTDVTISLSTEVATKSDITTEIGKLTAEGGSVKTLQTKVTEIETSLATGGTTANAIKAAQDAADAAQTQADKGVADAAAALAEAQKRISKVSEGTDSSLLTVETTGTEVTITLDGDVATKTHVAGEIKTVTDAATTLTGRVSAIETSLGEGGATTKAIADAKKAGTDAATAVTTLKDTDIATQTVSGSGISVTLDGTVGAPTLTGSVTTASYTSATETTAGSWTDEAKVATGAAVKAAIADLNAAHTKDIETVTAAVEALSTSGFERIIVTDLPSTGIKLNAIYLVSLNPTEKENNVYAEYIYVGGSVTDGVVSGGRFEQIGTTKTDLSEYAKTEKVTSDIATAKSEAIADAEGKVNTLAQTHATDKAELEEAISGVSQVVADTQSQLTEFVGTTYANDKKSLEDSIKAISDKVGETDVDAQIAAKIDAIGTGATQGTAGVTLTQSKGVVTLSVEPGKVESGNTSVVTGGAVYTAVNAATTAANNAQASANKKLASIGNDGDTRVIIGTPTADGDSKSVTIKLASTVATTTDGTAYSKTETDDAVKVAKDAADSKIAAVEVTTDAATHLGAHHISATTDADKKVTVAVSCSDEWEYTGAALTTVASVINGKMNDGKTIDDANLTSAEGMFQNNTALTTYVGSLGKLTNGKNMFNGCSGLTTFVADLASLTDGTNMFAGCALTEESLMYIVDSLPVASNKTITVGVAESVTNKADYAAEALKKGWTLA